MPITPLPPAPSRAEPSTFSAKGDALLGALDQFVEEANALEENVEALEEQTAANVILTNADVETASEAAATAVAAAESAVLTPGTMSTSTTSLTVGTGSKTLTIQTGKYFYVGMSVKIAYTTTPTTWMHGDITSYNSGTGELIVMVLTTSGSGTQAAWTVTPSAPGGPGYGANVFSGTQEVPAVKITTGAGASKILTSDADGDATWENTITVVNSGVNILGSSTGKTILASAITDTGDHTITFPAVTDSVAVLGNNTFTGTQSMPAAKITTGAGAGKVFVSDADGNGAWGAPQVVRSARTSDTILAAADKGTFIDVTSGTFTQTFTAAATLGSGWYCYYRNSGTGVVTLNPDGSETINGAATYVLGSGESRIIQCSGSAFYFAGGDRAGAQSQPTTSTWNLNALNYNSDGMSTLPDLTTTSDRFGIIKQTASATAMTTSDGWTITPPSGTINMPLVRDTAHGIWGGCSLMPPQIGSSGTVAAAMTVLGSVALSSTLHILYYAKTASTYDLYVIAYNPTTGSFGTAVGVGGDISSISDIGRGTAIYAVSGTSFIIFYGVTSGNYYACAGSVSTLTITLGTAWDSGQTFDKAIETPIQLSSTLYLIAFTPSTGSLQAISVSGTTISAGTAVDAGNPNGYSPFMAPIDSTRVLIMYGTAGATTCGLSFRVATLTGTSISLASAVSTATNVIKNSAYISLLIKVGSSYIAGGADTTTATTGNWYGVTVSGTTPTVGTVTAAANTAISNGSHSYRRQTVIYPFYRGLSAISVAVWDSSTIVAMRYATTYALAVGISGTTITCGTPVNVTAIGEFVSDAATSTAAYFVSSGRFSKYSISGTTLSITWAQAITGPTCVLSDTVNNISVNYGGTWYAWGAGLASGETAKCPVSSTSILTNVTTSIKIRGPIT